MGWGGVGWRVRNSVKGTELDEREREGVHMVWEGGMGGGGAGRGRYACLPRCSRALANHVLTSISFCSRRAFGLFRGCSRT